MEAYTPAPSAYRLSETSVGIKHATTSADGEPQSALGEGEAAAGGPLLNGKGDRDELCRSGPKPSENGAAEQIHAAGATRALKPNEDAPAQQACDQGRAAHEV
jgi:hypothetical protein